MRRIIAILGTLLAVAVLISGPVFAATWHYGVSVESYYNCTNPNEILGAPDDKYCSLGTSAEDLGEIIINLSYSGAMGRKQVFWVFAQSAYQEPYNVYISTRPDFADSVDLGLGYDDADQYFETPDEATIGWRYIQLVGVDGVSDPDPVYGPDIDAVGWFG
ncbi:MAG: hypothetical protein JSW28_04355 [Thermoplasmata archaeon]|nr:MAG: hypothetical protein JSW28_04355 [Thermoplasmata archaeon]